VAALAATGCASDQLHFASNRQMSSEPDIYNQQVLDNLARLAADPNTLPYFNTLDSGVPQVTDRLTFGGLLVFPAQTLVKQLHNQRGGQLGPLAGERDVNLNWVIKPVNDESRLRAMRCLYLWVLGRLQGCDLRLMSSVKDVSEIPTEGKHLIIVAAVGPVLHFRVFDGDGRLVVDTDETRLTEHTRHLELLRMQLGGLWPPHELTGSEKGRVINAVASIVDQTRLQPTEVFECETMIGRFYGGEDGKDNFNFGKVAQGWFQCGRWHDVPKDARYVIHHHGNCCWVVPGQEEALTDLSLRILRIALAAKRTKTVVRTYYNDEGRVAQQETSTEAGEKIVPTGARVPRAELRQQLQEILSRKSVKDEIVKMQNALNDHPELLKQFYTPAEINILKPNDVVNLQTAPAQDLIISKLENPIFLDVLRDQLKSTHPLAPLLLKLRDAAQDKLVLDSSKDPDLMIDTFSNPEISPGLITSPH